MTFQLVMAQALVVAVMLVLCSAAIAAARGRRGLLVMSIAMLAGCAFLAAGALFELSGVRLWVHAGASAAMLMMVYIPLSRSLLVKGG